MCKKTCICPKIVVPLQRQKVQTTKLIIMEAAVRQPITQYTGTISEEKWDNMHTIDELDATLKSIIHNHFYK